jgi:hypothetical protein
MVDQLLQLSVQERAHLDLAKELIELKFKVKINTIDFEDGSGKKFIVTTTDNPLRKRFINLY